jgi:hypothetical protein
MQTWLRSGSNCRVRAWLPGKIFRERPALREKPNKNAAFSLARRLQ